MLGQSRSRSLLALVPSRLTRIKYALYGRGGWGRPNSTASFGLLVPREHPRRAVRRLVPRGQGGMGSTSGKPIVFKVVLLRRCLHLHRSGKG